MNTYDTIIDLLNMEGPGLQDYVTPQQLDQLIDGTLAPAVIADQYLTDLNDSIIAAVRSDTAETRADLLAWIRMETELAVQQRKYIALEEAAIARLTALRALNQAEAHFIASIHHDKVKLARQALGRGATKSEVAQAANISRPTLDKWLAEAS